MVEIKAFLVKELRELTGAGIMECKKALIKSNADIRLAIEYMRKLGVIKAAKKASIITNNGVIKIKINSNYGIIIEVNCETDFVTKDIYFQNFAEKIINVAINRTTIEKLRAQLEEERIALVAKIGENINIRRIAFIEGDLLESYIHGTRIGVIVAAEGKNIEKTIIKQLAMHIAASKPEFLKPEDVSTEIIDNEYKLQLDIAMQAGKSKEIAEKIVKSRMDKFISEISLTKQPFILDIKKSVGQFLKEKNINLTGFIRFEVGELLEKN